jgi:hypothetical protein
VASPHGPMFSHRDSGRTLNASSRRPQLRIRGALRF